MANFLSPESLAKADAARRDANGQTASLDAIRKALRNPLRGDPVGLAKRTTSRRDEDEEDAADMVSTDDERADLKARRKAKTQADNRRGGVDAAKKSIASIHSQGAVPFDPDWLRKSQDPAEREEYDESRPSVRAVRKAQQHPLCMHPSANAPVNEAEVQRIIAQGKTQMRKGRPIFPATSANGQWGGEIADTGATNRWDDENAQRLATERVGGFSDSTIGPNDSRIRAAVTATGTVNRDAAVNAIKVDWARRKRQLAASFSARPAAHVDDTQKGESLADLGRQVGVDLRKALRR